MMPGLEGRTRREVLPAQIEQVVPWKVLRARTTRRGPSRPSALRLGDDAAHPFLQQGYALLDPAMKEALVDTR